MSDYLDGLILGIPGLPAEVSLAARVRRVAKILKTTYPQTVISTDTERGPHLIISTEDKRNVWVCVTQHMVVEDIRWAKEILRSEQAPHLGVLLVSTSGLIPPGVSHEAHETKIQLSREKTPEKIAERILRMLSSMRPNQIYTANKR